MLEDSIQQQKTESYNDHKGITLTLKLLVMAYKVDETSSFVDLFYLNLEK